MFGELWLDFAGSLGPLPRLRRGPQMPVPQRGSFLRKATTLASSAKVGQGFEVFCLVGRFSVGIAAIEQEHPVASRARGFEISPRKLFLGQRLNKRREPRAGGSQLQSGSRKSSAEPHSRRRYTPPGIYRPEDWPWPGTTGQKGGEHDCGLRGFGSRREVIIVAPALDLIQAHAEYASQCLRRGTGANPRWTDRRGNRDRQQSRRAG